MSKDEVVFTETEMTHCSSQPIPDPREPYWSLQTLPLLRGLNLV